VYDQNLPIGSFAATLAGKARQDRVVVVLRVRELELRAQRTTGTIGEKIPNRRAFRPLNPLELRDVCRRRIVE